MHVDAILYFKKRGGARAKKALGKEEQFTDKDLQEHREEEKRPTEEERAIRPKETAATVQTGGEKNPKWKEEGGGTGRQSRGEEHWKSGCVRSQELIV